MNKQLNGIRVLIFTLISTCVLSTNTYAENPTTSSQCSDSINLVIDGSIDIFHDKQGSKLDTTNTKLTKDLLSVSYYVVKLTDTTAWPNFMFHFFLSDFTLWEGICGLKITYKADHPLWLSLPQAVLQYYGHSYNVTLPATNQWKTVSVSLKDFKQPHWSTHKDIALNTKAIQGVAIAPDTDPQKSAKSGTFKIKEFIVYGVTNEKTDTLNSPIIFHGMNEGNIFASVKKAGIYQIEVQNSSGEIVSKLKDVNFKKDYNAIEFPNKLNNGIYYIKINNETESIRKICIYGNLPSYFKR